MRRIYTEKQYVGIWCKFCLFGKYYLLVYGGLVLIRVMYRDGKFDMIKPQMLDNLLEKHKVTSFLRSNGWAVVGRDSIRKGHSEGYWGDERRASCVESNLGVRQLLVKHSNAHLDKANLPVRTRETNIPDRRTGQQLIHAIKRDGNYLRLMAPGLDFLLEKGSVIMFRRLYGWVTVGIDPIRVKDRREVSRPFSELTQRSPF